MAPGEWAVVSAAAAASTPLGRRRHLVSTPVLVLALAAATALLPPPPAAHACRISEFFCDNGNCIGLDRFCDGHNDCGDKSDEPRQCTRCNRTFYGDRHKTYQVALEKPPKDKLPFYCQFTFIAGGGELGDLIELAFEHFNVGQLKSYSKNGCSDAHVQLVEHGRPPRAAGGWCGQASRWNVYYSETNNLTLILQTANWSQAERTEFEFKFNFRFLSKQDCVTRYGPPGALYHRGEFIPSTVCDRSFQDCDWQVCKVQSPNFPGIYPRNVTCFYHITQRTIPDGQHAMIVISQKNEDKLSIKTGETFKGPLPTSYSYRQERQLLFGDNCKQDYIRVFDGANSSDPFLIKFCRSGALSDIISSGPDLLVEFQSSAYDHPEMNHFELDVRVIFLPEDLIGARLIDQRCEWSIRSHEQQQGVVYSLQHFTQPNTTCHYRFRGGEHEFVWIYFVQYFPDSRKDPHRDESNLFRLELWERGPDEHGEMTMQRLLDEIYGDKVPRMCVHARSFPDLVPVRPCKHPEESYVTNTSELFLRYTVSPDAQLDSLKFLARYEFVNVYQEGQPTPGGGPCDRIFISSKHRRRGSFASPHNVFLFGRGGNKNLACSYTFHATNKERVRLYIQSLKVGRRKCRTFYAGDTNRYFCQYISKDQRAELHIYDRLWNMTNVPLACICNVTRTIEIESLGPMIQVNYTVQDMTSSEDFNDYSFEGVYEFVPALDCSRNNHIDDSTGEISEEVTENEISRHDLRLKCPWYIAPPPDKFVYLRVQGMLASDPSCDTTNRVVVLSPGEPDPVAVVCPGPEDPSAQVELFSRDWNKTNAIKFPPKQASSSNALVVEFLVREPGSFSVSWLKVAKASSGKVLGMKLKSDDCIYKCPELNACISAILWCDGKRHCPSGIDEDEETCAKNHFSWLYIGVGVGCIMVVLLLLLGALIHRRREAAAKKGKPVPTDEYPTDSKESEC